MLCVKRHCITQWLVWWFILAIHTYLKNAGLSLKRYFIAKMKTLLCHSKSVWLICFCRRTSSPIGFLCMGTKTTETFLQYHRKIRHIQVLNDTRVNKCWQNFLGELSLSRAFYIFYLILNSCPTGAVNWQLNKLGRRFQLMFLRTYVYMKARYTLQGIDEWKF